LDATSRSASLYYRLPAPLQNLVLYGEGRRRARIRFGSAFNERLEFLRGSDLWGAARIREYQDAQVAAIVEKAYRETDYYRQIMDERGLGPEDIRGVTDLAKLPILTKEDIRENRHRMVTSTATVRQLHTIHTSGSTGPPMRILTPKEGLAFKWAVWWRHRERFGISRGARNASVSSTPWVPAEQQHPPYWRWNRVENQAFIPLQQIVPAKIESIVRFLNTHQFGFWTGYPSILHSLVIAATEAGLEATNGPRVIFTGAERLFDHQRADLAAFTGAVVSQMYGFNEAAGNASECPAGNLHEDFEFGYMECVNPVVDEDTGNVRGRIVATGFSNPAMPLIRYEVGDVGVWRPDGYACPCGRATRVLAAVDGRVEDYVVTPRGHRVRRVGDIFANLPDLKQFQIIQTRPEDITIRLVVRDPFGQHQEDLLRRRAGLWISDSLTVNFEYVDAIEPAPNGKVRIVVGLISDDR